MRPNPSVNGSFAAVFMRTGLLFLLLAATMVQSGVTGALAQVDDEGSPLKLYQIVRTSAVDSQIHRLPGEKYIVQYEIFADCYGRFRDVEEYKLQIQARLGADNPYGKTIEEKQIWKHDCNETKELWYEHTVPYPQDINPYNTDPATDITITMCPESWAGEVRCAFHNILVRNSTRGGWFVDLFEKDARTSAPNVLRFSGAAYNYTRRNTWPGEKEIIFIRTVDLNKPSISAVIVDRKQMDATEHFVADEFSFEDYPPRDGTYHYKVCVVGEDAAGWPTSFCSAQLMVVVDNVAKTWAVGVVVVKPPDGGFSLAVAANQAFQIGIAIRNRTDRDQPAGSMRFRVLRRTGGGGPFVDVGEGLLRAVAGRTTTNQQIDQEPLGEGSYEFKACLIEPQQNANSLCGAWSEIVVTAANQIPPPQPDASKNNELQLAPKCPEGAKKSGNKCACAGIAKWSSKTNKCVKPAQRRCNKPFVYDKSTRICVCPEGLTKIGNSCKRKSTKAPDRLKCPEGAKKSGRKCICAGVAKWNSKTNKCVKPAQRRCNKPFVYDKSSKTCVCAKGLTKIGNTCKQKSTTVPDRLQCPEGAKKSGKRCICAGIAKWNSKTNKCVKPAQRRCNKPFVYNKGSKTCVCPKGLTKIGNSCKRKSITAPVCSDKKRRKSNGECCPKKTVARLNRCVKLK